MNTFRILVWIIICGVTLVALSLMMAAGALNPG
jgi:hypothetical protein